MELSLTIVRQGASRVIDLHLGKLDLYDPLSAMWTLEVN